MSFEWPTKALKECIVKIIDNRGKTPPLSESRTLFNLVEVNAIVGCQKYPDLKVIRKYVEESTYKSWFRAGHPELGDIIFSTVGSIAEVAIVNTNTICIAQNLIALRVNKNVVLSDFLYYLLISPIIQNTLHSLDISSVQPSIKVPHLLNVDIPLPSLQEQEGISGVLSSLDNRISLLRETNTTLEAIAQALFKSWFVDFDPVKAKVQGKQPEGMDEATAALFPSEFEESALGLIPKGWNYCSFIETINVIGGGTPKTSIAEYWNGEIPWFSVVDAPSATDVFVIDTEKYITEIGLKNSSTKLLSEGVTIISARGTVGKLALVGQKMAMNQSCYGLQGKAGDAYFTYFSTLRLVEILKQRTHGSVFDTITRDTFGGVSVVYPSIQVINAFESVVYEVMDRIKLNLQQSQTLTTLRDTLLPRLISGQLRIKQAQDLINEVGA